MWRGAGGDRRSPGSLSPYACGSVACTIRWAPRPSACRPIWKLQVRCSPARSHWPLRGSTGSSLRMTTSRGRREALQRPQEPPGRRERGTSRSSVTTGTADMSGGAVNMHLFACSSRSRGYRGGCQLDVRFCPLQNHPATKANG